MENKELRRKIETFSLDDGHLGNQGYERVLLQLFGYTGHGKSSFINSCKYVLDDGGPFVVHAQAGQRSDGASMTMIRKAYPLTPNITIVDNRGLRTMTEFERAEVYAQLGNFYPLNKEVKWKTNFKETLSAMEESELNPNFSDFLVPIYIYSGKYALKGQDKEDVREFLRNCVQMTGVVPIIVLTHKSRGGHQDTVKEFRLLGAEEIICIENYTSANFMKTPERHNDILRVLEKALDNVRFRLDQPRHPRKDWITRKNFLLDYTHQAVANQREKLYKNLYEALEKEKREREERQRPRRDTEDTDLGLLEFIKKPLLETARSCTLL